MNTLLIATVFGLIAGLVYEIGYIIRALFKFTLLPTLIVDFVSTIFAGFLFSYCILVYNYGIIRLYCLLGFILGYIICLISIGNLVAKAVNLIYNYIVIKKKNFEDRRAIKKEAKNAKYKID